MKKYHLKYDLKFEHSAEGFTKEEIKKLGWGGCDALVLISIVREGKKAHDGAMSQTMLTIDGQNLGKPIPDSELFHHLFMPADKLQHSKTATNWQNHICAEFVQVTREYMAMIRNKEHQHECE